MMLSSDLLSLALDVVDCLRLCGEIARAVGSGWGVEKDSRAGVLLALRLRNLATYWDAWNEETERCRDGLVIVEAAIGERFASGLSFPWRSAAGIWIFI